MAENWKDKMKLNETTFNDYNYESEYEQTSQGRSFKTEPPYTYPEEDNCKSNKNPNFW